MTLPSAQFSFQLKEDHLTSDTQGDSAEEEEAYDQPKHWNAIFQDYIFEELIAESEASLVWLGLSKDSNCRVALKITEIIQTVSSRTMHSQKQRLFVEQHRLKHMVTIKEIKENTGYRLLVMEYYPWSLDRLLNHVSSGNRRYTQSHLQFIFYVFKQILTAVEELHALGYVHRDLKLDNFMVDHEGQVYLNDFELVTKELEIDPSLSGTLEYMPPERLSKKRMTEPIAKSVDIWSLGIILYELYTGKTPYNGDNAQEILDQIYQIYAQSQQISSEMMSLIQAMLQIRPQNRLGLGEIRNNRVFQQETNASVIKQLIRG